MLQVERAGKPPAGLDAAAGPRAGSAPARRYRPAHDSIVDAVGNTPCVRLHNLERKEGLQCELWAKCEYLNPGGSVKDRIGAQMVLDAEAQGRIKPGDTLIEPTSGNTGIGLALAAAVKGYRCIICMPEKMSKEKADVLRALGAEIIRTPTEAAWDAPESHISVAKRLEKEIPNAHILDQYGNSSNPMAHYKNTAEEILEALGGRVDMLVAGAGTGGTITGLAKRLKEACPAVRIVGADPKGSILAQPASLNKEEDNKPYLVEGIGYDFVPDVLDRGLVDEWHKTVDSDSFAIARRLIREEGLLCGGSSGSAMSVALQAAKKLGPGQRCVVILPDSIRNYMTKHLSDEWMIEQGFGNLINLDQSDMIPDAQASGWWNSSVGDLPLPTPCTVTPDMSCEAVVKLLREEGFDQLPIVDEKGEIHGVVTESNMLFKLARVAGKDLKTMPVAQVAFKKFKEVGLSTKLWELSRILDRQPFVLVTASQRVFTGHNESQERRLVLSVLTRIDLINHIMTQLPNGDGHTISLTRTASYPEMTPEKV